MGDLEHALSAYENALRHNPMSIPGLTQVAGIARIKENYPMAVEYFQRVLNLQSDNGEIWSALGHCYLMQDDLQKAYSAYQQALYSLPNPKENPKLWYGIGILYDRYGSLDNAEEAFASVLKMDKVLTDFDKSNEVLFRLGIIYKQQTKYEDSLRCFDRILRNPPSPLAHADIWFQIGHVYEQQGDHRRAKESYERVVQENDHHAKVLQQLGWLYHQDGPEFQSQETAIQYLTKSLEADPSDAQSWYLLGRAYMAGQKYNKAYEAYQQAVYRDGRNPTFWCSIGVLYFQINQFRDALDAYSRAIRINPYIPEVWFDLGSLYESCNNQISDAIDAYARAAELDQNNRAITERLQMLKHSQATGAQLPAAPPPQDVHPTAYASAVVPPPGLAGPPLMLHAGGPRPIFRADSRGPDSSISMPPPPQLGPGRTSPAPFRGGPPPPVVLDDSRRGPLHTPLAPMDVDHIPPHVRESNGAYAPPPVGRDVHTRGGQLNMLLHHTGPQVHEQEPRGPAPHHDPYYGRTSRPPSHPASPPPHVRAHSPVASPYQGYSHNGRLPPGPGQSSSHSRSPHMYGREVSNSHPSELGWERRDWERGRRGPPSSEYPGHPAQHTPQHTPYYPARAPSPPPRRVASPPHSRGREPVEPPHIPRPSSRQQYYEMQRSGAMAPPSPPIPVSHESIGGHRPYGEPADHGRSMGRGGPPPFVGSSVRGSESPHVSQRGSSVAPESKRRGGRKEKEVEIPAGGPPPAPEPVKKERKKRASTKRTREDSVRAETPKPSYAANDRMQGSQLQPFKVSYASAKPNDSPEPTSSNGSSSNHRSVQPSPINPISVSRVVDEDYDEGVADTLLNLSRAPEQGYHVTISGPAVSGAAKRVSPTPSMTSRHSHRGSISSTRSQHTPPSAGSKRPLSPASDETDNKRTRMEAPSSMRRGPSPPPSSSMSHSSTRPSPAPYRTGPSSRSPENRQLDKSKQSYPSSPQLPAVLPPHPRPIGAGLAHSSSVNLPPIATLSPASSAPSPADADRMQVDREGRRSHSRTPPTASSGRGKFSDVMNPSTGPGSASSSQNVSVKGPGSAGSGGADKSS
ncbi:TPR-like protein [Stereum hirsutum FP-91666 SS1]|uniref:TPR-like protein n=1 Tax=Stereum hirsutum (strain FP-91666) TaxID=721885 RepID=UPI000444A69B|nr:TPR-like protein [Stereum hirsutum FP-91666 SS1]EIM83322.1 TPR-like protein [Stereum hirsutum FP-91666 SS1]